MYEEFDPAAALAAPEPSATADSGHVLVIEGTGWERPAGGAEQPTFNAVAVLTHDSSGYRRRSYLMEGRSGDFEVVPADSGFAWGFETPQGRVRYTMRLTPGGKWREMGEFSQDGATWRQFMEMLLPRVP